MGYLTAVLNLRVRLTARKTADQRAAGKLTALQRDLSMVEWTALHWVEQMDVWTCLALEKERQLEPLKLKAMHLDEETARVSVLGSYWDCP